VFFFIIFENNRVLALLNYKGKDLKMKFEEEILNYFPCNIYKLLKKEINENIKKDIEEIRIRCDRPIIFKFRNEDIIINYIINQCELLQVLETNKDNYNKLLTSLVLKNRTKNAQLEENDTFKKLRELEKKMQVNENNIYSLQSYIDSKTDENQFGHLLKDCMALQEQINAILIKNN
jgi:hypothetical protein